MSNELKKLKALLTELFQLDAAEDLDFGMYRVLRLRRNELTTFLEQTLTAEVQKALGSVGGAERAVIDTRMRELEQQAAAFGAKADGNPEYIQLRQRRADLGEATDLERQVYAHLYEFLSRYYEDGDFLSRPRMKKDTYAIPYDGSEVVLHWANKDQYYVKSGEYFARYAFQLQDGRRVLFRLVDAETDPDNVKSADAGKRRFRLVEKDPVVVEGGELVCRFVYVPVEGKKQEGVNEESEARILAEAPRDWRGELRAAAPQGSAPTLLLWHLRQYTEKNRRDYFIHKDLGKFLNGELDHYLKTEVFDLDTVEQMSDAAVGRSLSLLKTIRAVARPIIIFLASMEDFQRRLFLKKKLVLRTDWCISLDRVPSEFYAEIAEKAVQVPRGQDKSQAQRWQELFALDTVPAKGALFAQQTPLGGGGLKSAFLADNPGFVLETRFFDADFVGRLLAALGKGVDEQVTGVMVRGENFHGLALLSPLYRQAIDTIYIDPPYNTDASSISYKNGYKSSSWATLIRDRVELGRSLLTNRGVLTAAIDDEQQRELSFILDTSFYGNILGTICVRSNPSGRPKKTGYAVSHEYLFFVGKGEKSAIGRLPPTPDQRSRFSQVDTLGSFEWRNLRREGSNSDRAARPALYYPIYINKDKIRVPKMAWVESTQAWRVDDELLDGERAVWPNNDDGIQKTWRWEGSTVTSEIQNLAVRPDRTGQPYVYYKRRPHEDGVVAVSSWSDARYSATEHGTALLKSLFNTVPFSYPKSIFAVEDAVFVSGAAKHDATILDFFAGSGTTGHAVLNLNREDEGKRKFILIEVNDYFDTVLVPRILKASYSKDWKDGKPVDRTPVPGGVLYKILYLESYEDSLANITLPPPPSENPLPLGLQRAYTIQYMLEHQTRQAALDLDQFRKPFSWTMEVRRGGLVDPAHPVDLVESFNYLIGLRVSRYGFFGDMQKIRYVEGSVFEDGNERKVLVLWRDCERVPDEELVRMFNNREFAPIHNREYDRIYVNGDPPLANIRRNDEQWKVLAIEDEFKRLAFAEEGA